MFFFFYYYYFSSSSSVTPAADSDQSHCSVSQNGPFSTCEPHPTDANYSSDNDEDSGTDDEALQKEMKRLKEKCAPGSASCLAGWDSSYAPFLKRLHLLPGT